MRTLSAHGLFSKSCEFIMSCAEVEGLPDALYPEIAFAGRSNVGKSSLINTLTGKKGLAHASSTPGRTQQINFFLLAEMLMLVDLPGYGYAKASSADSVKWMRLVRDYLKGRPNLARVLLLVDSRHGLKQADQDTMTLLDDIAVSYQIVLTKADKLKPAELAQVSEKTNLLIARHPAAHPSVVLTSAQTGAGMEELREELAGFAGKNR